MPKNVGGTLPLVRTLFEKFLKGHVRTFPGNVFVKFEVRICNHVAAISI